MADKSISELAVAQQMTDDALLVAYQNGETRSIEGQLIKQYARESTKQYVEGAVQSAEEAKESAEAAKVARKGIEAYAEQAGNSAAVAAGSAAEAEAAKTAAEAVQADVEANASAARAAAAAAAASETAAGKSETNAAGSATAADKSRLDAQTAQIAAEAAKTDAESSATLAGNKATEASESAAGAAGSATAAAGSASEASKAKSDAEAAKTAAQTAKTGAEAAKVASEKAKTDALDAQKKAEAARDAAGTSAAGAADSAAAAGASKTAAAESAQTATSKAEEAATSAGAAKTSETNSKQSETAAGLSADAAEQARQAIEALGVQGVTLAAGSQVTVEKLVAADGTVTLKFSIPQGAKGDKGNKGDQGISIASIQRTAGAGAAGTTDTYTITMSDGSTSSFTVYNGRDGEGAGDMLANVYDPQGKAAQVATEKELTDGLVGKADLVDGKVKSEQLPPIKTDQVVEQTATPTSPDTILWVDPDGETPGVDIEGIRATAEEAKAEADGSVTRLNSVDESITVINNALSALSERVTLLINSINKVNKYRTPGITQPTGTKNWVSFASAHNGWINYTGSFEADAPFFGSFSILTGDEPGEDIAIPLIAFSTSIPIFFVSNNDTTTTIIPCTVESEPNRSLITFTPTSAIADGGKVYFNFTLPTLSAFEQG